MNHLYVLQIQQTCHCIWNFF